MVERLPSIIYVAGIIERFDNRLLIARSPASDAAEALWGFPFGQTEPNESPEAAMRRIALADLGMRIEIVIGQPPLVQDVEGRAVQIRYFLCGLISGEENPGSQSHAEQRWIEKSQISEYDFAETFQPILGWLQEA